MVTNLTYTHPPIVPYHLHEICMKELHNYTANIAAYVTDLISQPLFVIIGFYTIPITIRL